MSTPNYYDVLGIKSNATYDEIKSAFRRLSKKFHPDINKDADPKIFRMIKESYETLSNKDKRYFYDLKLRNQHKESNNFTLCGTKKYSVVNISVSTSISGGTIEATFIDKVKCKFCSSIGARCMTCKGTGKIKNFGEEITCPRCNGHKFENPHKCDKWVR